MSEELGSRLSGEDIRRFEKAVSDAKALTVRQEEIAKQVLEVEKEIGQVRLASLNKYLDTYSKGLDEIIARKTSQLNDAFLVMEQRAVESFKKLADEAAAEVADRYASVAKNNNTKTDNPGTTKTTEHTAAESKPKTQTKPDITDSVYTDTSSGPQDTSSYISNNPNGNNGDVTADTGTSVPSSGNEDGGDDNGGAGATPTPADNSDPVSNFSSEITDKVAEQEDAVAGIVDALKAFSNAHGKSEEQLNALDEEEEAINSLIQLDELRDKKRKKFQEGYGEAEKELAETYAELMLAKSIADERSADAQEFRLNRIKELQIANIQEVIEAERDAQNLINEIRAEQAYVDKDPEEAAELRAKKSAADDEIKSIKQIQDAKNAYIAKEELRAKAKNGGVLDKEEAKRIRKQADEKFKIESENIEKLNKKRAKQEAKDDAKERGQKIKTDTNTLFSKDASWDDKKEAFYNLTHDDAGNVDGSKIVAASVSALDKGLKALSNFARQLETKIDDIGSLKSAIDTRLQGSSNKTTNGSYWDQMVKDMTRIGAVNPFYKQSDFAANIKSLVDTGIAFDLEQRAFLMTIQGKIANTFDVADATLLRLIRIQQEDTTAGRLGMEAALNSFLNNMYENTEYLKQVANSVRVNLAEMQSLMEGAEATEVEYQVQKWMGSLYSVGMSQDAVTKISNALGQIGAGQIEGLTGDGAGNLLIMAANDAGLSIADMLTDGLDASDTNKLMQAAVNYLAELAESSKDNNVVQQQLAGVFGVKASDLKAATNLATKDSIGAIYNKSMTYSNMLSYLTTMASSMGDRTSLSEKMTNIWDNVQYSIAGSMASNPVTYLIYKVASVLTDTTGGIQIPAINILGNMVDLDTSVADLMRIGAMSGGILGSLGDLIAGLGNSFSGQAMLNQVGISAGSGIAVTPRGDGGLSSTVGGGSSSTSGSGYVGNASSSDIKNSTMQQAEDDKKQLMVEAQEEAEANEVNVLNTTVLKIYELLDDVAHGGGCFRVKVDSYGLTKAGSSNSIGGVGALGNLSDNGSAFGGNQNSTSGSSLSGGGVNSGGFGGNIDFGGWTMTM